MPTAPARRQRGRADLICGLFVTWYELGDDGSLAPTRRAPWPEEHEAADAFGAALLVLVFAALVVANVHVSRGYFAGLEQRSALRDRFAQLSARHTNSCTLARVDAKTQLRGRLQGSCCSPMDYDHYAEQVVGLRAYAHLGEIPPDPYDVSVALARRLTAFNGSVSLSPAQQRTYDRAVRLSDEQGPCCCSCWRWHAL